MKKYLNVKTSYGVETVDSLNSQDFATVTEFRKELHRLVSEYRLSGQDVYISQRKAKE